MKSRPQNQNICYVQYQFVVRFFENNSICIVRVLTVFVYEINADLWIKD